MGLGVEDMYWRIYADYPRRIYTYCCVPLKRATHHEIVADEDTLSEIRLGLQARGWRQVQRRAFELYATLDVITAINDLHN
jgi:hypothetical protein